MPTSAQRSYIILRDPVPVWLLDGDSLGWGYRTAKAPWLEALGPDIACAFERLAMYDINNLAVKKECKGGTRGDHVPIIIGHYRQSAKVWIDLFY